MKKITMKDIAIKAGVSKATVSMVINKKQVKIKTETKDRIMKLAEELNYIPNGIARSLSTKKSQTIGIILPDITNPFFSEMARAVEDTAGLLNYNVIFCNTDNDYKKEEECVKLLIGKSVDGVIFITGRGTKESLDILKRNNIQFILVDRHMENHESYPGVYCLNREGVVEGIEYLIKQGRKNIALVTGKKELMVSKQRIDGYIETMNRYKLKFCGLIFEGDFTIEGGIKATQEIIQSKKAIDAIFYSNDAMALGGLKFLKRENFKVPEDIAIIGFDNIKTCSLIEPELTTIAQPIYDMGKKACEVLIDIINNNIVNKQFYFKSKLIKRGTA